MNSASDGSATTGADILDAMLFTVRAAIYVRLPLPAVCSDREAYVLASSDMPRSAR